MKDSSGIIYVISNKYMPGLVKIGMTKRENVKKRMRELYTTSIPCKFDCNYACEVENCKQVEEALHKAFSTDRVNLKREFFNMSADRIIPILKILEKKNITSEISKSLGQDVSKEENDSVEKFYKTHRRPPLNFEEMGIPTGSELKMQYIEKEYIATVISPRKILFDDEETSLTAATKKIREIKHDIQPTPLWTYNGKKLSDIYNETYSSFED